MMKKGNRKRKLTMSLRFLLTTRPALTLLSFPTLVMATLLQTSSMNVLLARLMRRMTSSAWKEKLKKMMKKMKEKEGHLLLVQQICKKKASLQTRRRT